MKMWKAYRAFDTGIQWTLAMSFFIGIALLIGGIWIDLAPPGWWPKWWSKLSFGTNILASATGFFIGVPVALIALDVIVAGRDQKIKLLDAANVSERAWNDFSRELRKFCDNNRVSALVDSVPEVDRWGREILSYEGVFGDSDPQFTPANLRTISEISNSMQEHYREMLGYISEWVGQPADISRHWAMIEARWITLDSFVRPLRTSLDLPWLDVVADAQFRRHFVAKKNPLTEFAYCHEKLSASLPPRIDDLYEKVFSERIPLESEPGEFIRNQFHALLTSKRANQHAQKGAEAADFLLGLVSALDLIDATKWPKK